MNLSEALQIVLELAKQGALTEYDDNADELAGEIQRQQEAIDEVEAFAAKLELADPQLPGLGEEEKTDAEVVAEPIADELETLVTRYVEVMEDYSAGFPITNPDHPHHEDWTRAKSVLARLEKARSKT